MRQYDDMLPVSLMNDHNREVFILVDRRNDHVADFNRARDDHECQRIVELINANDAALRRAKAEVWREAIMGVTNLKADMENGVPPSERMGFSRACNEIIGYARAAQIEEGTHDKA